MDGRDRIGAMRFGIFSVDDHPDFPAIMNFGGLAPARVLRSMEPMARHVLPAFRG